MQKLAKALRGASTEVQDVDAAQANLVKIVFRLSNDGDILLSLKNDIYF